MIRPLDKITPYKKFCAVVDITCIEALHCLYDRRVTQKDIAFYRSNGPPRDGAALATYRGDADQSG